MENNAISRTKLDSSMCMNKHKYKNNINFDLEKDIPLNCKEFILILTKENVGIRWHEENTFIFDISFASKKLIWLILYKQQYLL